MRGVLLGFSEAGLSWRTIKMYSTIKRKQRLQLGFVGLVIISFSLLIVSVLARISSIKATCQPLSAANQVSEWQVPKEPQPQIIEESAPVTAEDTAVESTVESTFVADTDSKPEPDMTEAPKPEVVEGTEAQTIENEDAATETFAATEPEENLEVSERGVVEEPEPEIVEESTSVAAEEVPSEPELSEEPDIESVEASETAPVAADELEATEQVEPEEDLFESEPWAAEDAQYESTVESAFLADTNPEPEPDIIEEPNLQVIEETETQAVEDTGTEILAGMEPEEGLDVSEQEVVEEPQPEIIEESTSVAAEETPSVPELSEEPNIENVEMSEPVPVVADELDATDQAELEESLVESEPWAAEDAQYESAMESAFVADTEPEPESDIIEEPNVEVIEKTESRTIEGTDAETFVEMGPDETLEAYELETVEEPQPQIIDESASVAAEEVPFEPELLEEPNLESVEISELVPVVPDELEATEQTESEESINEPEPRAAEDARYESTVESTFVVHTDPMLEPEMIEEPEPETWAVEESDTETLTEMEPEDTLVPYELEAVEVEEPRQESVEDQESAVSPLLREILGKHKTAHVESTPAESIEASEPKVAERSRSEVPVVEEEEAGSVSLRLANIIGGKARPAVTDEPQAATTEKAKSDKKASEPQVVEKPRQQTVEKKKSIFSFFLSIFKGSDDKTK
jgi:hypothetical protein